MSKLKLILVFVLAVGAFFVQQAQAVQMKRYQIKSGNVKYIYKGNGGMGIRSGEENVVWNNFGLKEKRTSTYDVEVLGFKQTHSSIQFIDGEWSYSLDPKTNQAMRIKYSDMFKNKTNDKKMQGQWFSEDMIKSLGAVKKGKKTILNKKCTNYFMEEWGSEVCVYKGVPLITVMDYMGIGMTIEAVEFIENAKVQTKELALPSNVDIVDAPQIAQAGLTSDQAASVKEALGMFKQMQNANKELAEDPEYQEYLEYKRQKEAMQDQAEQNQPTTASSQDPGKSAADAIKGAAVGGVKDGVKNETRRGMRNLISGAVRSLF